MRIKYIILSSLFILQIVGAQGPTLFTGHVSFTYTGTINGTFDASTGLELDSLTLPEEGALAVAFPDSGVTQVFMAAFQQTGNQVYRLMVTYLKDTTGVLNPQSWSFPTDITNPKALFLFLPQVDSSLVSDLVGLMDTTGIDSSSADSLFLEVIGNLLEMAYLATGGTLDLATSGIDSLGGSFDLFCVQLPFSPLTISNGTFAFHPLSSFAMTVSSSVPLPQQFTLRPVSPNPFNPITRINYSLDRDSQMTLEVYDINGRLVERLYRGWNTTGTHRITWDASRFSSGLYILRLEAAGRNLTQKMLLLK